MIAHAGGEGLGPANSILAMQRSLDAGADVLDADLWMTSDGVIVAAHDRSLALTTGVAGNIDEVSSAQLASLDLRSGWTGAEITEPVRIPSLSAIIAAFPDVPISLEIKQDQPPLTDELCRLLTSTGSLGRVYVSANQDDTLYAFRDRCDGALITTTYADVDQMRAAREDPASNWCAPAPIGQPPYRPDRFDPAGVAWSHDHGLAIFTWTVDDPATLRQLAEAGVDGVYTRRPDVARRVFDEFAAEDE